MDKNFKFIRVTGSAYGYYSDSSYNGEALLPMCFLPLLKEGNINVYASELDGKYSDVKVDIEYKVVTLKEYEDLEAEDFDESDQFQDSLEWELSDKYIKLGNSFPIKFKPKEVYKIMNDLEDKVFKNIDRLVNCTVQVRQSNVKKLLDFAENL